MGFTDSNAPNLQQLTLYHCREEERETETQRWRERLQDNSNTQYIKHQEMLIIGSEWFRRNKERNILYGERTLQRVVEGRGQMSRGREGRGAERRWKYYGLQATLIESLMETLNTFQIAVKSATFHTLHSIKRTLNSPGRYSVARVDSLEQLCRSSRNTIQFRWKVGLVNMYSIIQSYSKQKIWKI